MTEKRCSSCGEVKPLSKFYKNKAQKDGYSNQCKECADKSITKSILRKFNPKWSDLKNLKRHCRLFATNQDVAIEDVLELQKAINDYVDKYELEDANETKTTNIE